MESPALERAPLQTQEEGPEALKKRIEELEAQNELLATRIGYLEEKLGIDFLTGAKNREVFTRELELALRMIRGEITEQRAGVESLREISLISIDLDHFKLVNDTFGHLAGDEVLQKAVAFLTSSVRDTDMVARVGGEELVVLLRGVDETFAAQKAEELRAGIEHLAFDASPELKVTASFGVISSNNSADERVLLERVDQALYKAKHSGRNRVEVA